MEQFSFENLETYNQAMRLVKMTYELAEKFPNHEKYGLYNQIHRAIVSIPSNIAESCGRKSYKEKIHFIEIAYGSLLESYCQLQIAVNVNYITVEEFLAIKPQFFTVSRLMNALNNSYVKQIETNHKPLNP